MVEDIVGASKEGQGGRRRNKVVRIIAFSLCTVLFLICIGIKVDTYRDFKRDLTSYQDVKVGDSMDEIKYALGYPPLVLSPAATADPIWGGLLLEHQTDGKDPNNPMPDGKKVEDFVYWQYGQADHRIDLSFDPKTKRISEIGCYAYLTSAGATQPQYCPGLFGIDTNSTEADVLAMLGPADTVSLNSSKSLWYRTLGLEVTLTKRRVYMLKKTSPVGSSDWWFLTHRLF